MSATIESTTFTLENLVSCMQSLFTANEKTLLGREVDEIVQAAFQRGFQAGKFNMRNPEKAGPPWDQVYQAQCAGIDDPGTLSNLYSKEHGFKQ